MSATNTDQALFQKLSADTGILAVVGSQGHPAVYLGLLPENAKENGQFPAVTFWSIMDKDPATSHDGASGLFRTRYQFTCWGLTLTDSRVLSRALVKVLHGFKGVVGGYELGPCFLISSVSTFDQNENLFMTHLDFHVWNQG